MKWTKLLLLNGRPVHWRAGGAKRRATPSSPLAEFNSTWRGWTSAAHLCYGEVGKYCFSFHGKQKPVDAYFLSITHCGELQCTNICSLPSCTEIHEIQYKLWFFYSFLYSQFWRVVAMSLLKGNMATFFLMHFHSSTRLFTEFMGVFRPASCFFFGATVIKITPECDRTGGRRLPRRDGLSSSNRLGDWHNCYAHLL